VWCLIGDPVSWQALGWIALGASLLVCLGLLLGATWTIQALQPRLCRQAEERRRLNAEWAAVHAARRHRETCPRCACPLTDRGSSVERTLVEDSPDD
jgi:hypothetical protein